MLVLGLSVLGWVLVLAPRGCGGGGVTYLKLSNNLWPKVLSTSFIELKVLKILGGKLLSKQ